MNWTKTKRIPETYKSDAGYTIEAHIPSEYGYKCKSPDGYLVHDNHQLDDLMRAAEQHVNDVNLTPCECESAAIHLHRLGAVLSVKDYTLFEVLIDAKLIPDDAASEMAQYFDYDS